MSKNTIFNLLSIWEQWSNANDPLKDRTFLGKKKLFFNFMGANILAPKRSHRCEKKSVLGSGKPVVMMVVKVSNDI